MTATPWSSAPPVPFEPPASLHVDRPADIAVLAACAVSAVGADLAVRSGVLGLAAATMPFAACASLLATRRFPNPQAKALLALAPVVTAFLALRRSGAAVGPDALAGAFLVVLGASLARGGSLLDLTFPRLAGRLALTTTHGLLAPAFVVRPLARLLGGRPRSWAVARGLAIGIPVVAILTALLASADAVFASFLRVPDLGHLPADVLLLGFGSGVAATLLRQASSPTGELPLGAARAIGRLEARMVLGGLCAVYAAFAAAQVAVVSGAADRILSHKGLTYAEYARRGFFQLLAAAGLTAVILLCLRPGLHHDAAGPAMALVAVALTGVVVALAVRRLSLYEKAYGLTLLRLASTAGAVWISLVFLLIGLAVAGVGAGRSWLPAAVGAAALVGLLGWNLADPGALVARRDLDRAQVDPIYLVSLGDDAVPTITARLDRLDPGVRTELVARICAAPTEPRHGALQWNRAATRAATARARLGC